MFHATAVLLDNGKFVTYIDNVVYGCNTDFDCPFGTKTVCMLKSDVPWTNDSTCHCDAFYGRFGNDCRELNSGGITLAFVMAATMTLCLIAVAKFLYYWYLLFQHKVKFEFNAIQTTFVSLTISSVALLMYCCVSLSRIGGETLSATEKTADGLHRTPYLHIFISICQVVFLSFYAVTLLNICVVWIEISRRSRHLNAKVSKNLTIYGKYVYAYNIVVVVVSAILVGLQYGIALQIFLAVVIFLILLTYIYGAMLMYRILKFIKATKEQVGVRASEMPTTPSSGEKIKQSVIDKQIGEIVKITVALACVMLVALVTLAVMAQLEGATYRLNYPTFPLGFTIFFAGSYGSCVVGYHILDQFVKPRLLAKIVMGNTAPSGAHTHSNDAVAVVGSPEMSSTRLKSNRTLPPQE